MQSHQKQNLLLYSPRRQSIIEDIEADDVGLSKVWPMMLRAEILFQFAIHIKLFIQLTDIVIYILAGEVKL